MNSTRGLNEIINVKYRDSRSYFSDCVAHHLEREKLNWLQFQISIRATN